MLLRPAHTMATLKLVIPIKVIAMSYKKSENLAEMARVERELENAKKRSAFMAPKENMFSHVRRNNEKMLVIRRRPAKVRPGLEFNSLGPWGF